MVNQDTNYTQRYQDLVELILHNIRIVEALMWQESEMGTDTSAKWPGGHFANLYPCWHKPLERSLLKSTVHKVTKSWTWLSEPHAHTLYLRVKMWWESWLPSRRTAGSYCKSRGISPKKTYRWLTNTWKDAQRHSLSETCKPKPLWGTISHQSEWLRSKSLQVINAGEGVEKREPSSTVGENAN